MTAIPATFRAYVAEKVDDRVERGVREFARDGPAAGEVEIRVGWSSVNYKDGLATRADGKVARISPLIPGIDLAGEVDRQRRPGDRRRVSRARARLRARRVAPRWLHASTSGCRPAGWCRSRRACRRARRWRSGRPGSPRRCPWSRSRSAGSTPADGPVLVTGASGGVGGTAAGDPRRARLRGLGGDRQARRGAPAADAGRGRDPGAGRGHRRGPAARSGTVGRRGRRGRRGDAPVRAADAARTAAAVAASGNAGGAELDTTVFPFILRGVALLGMDSVNDADRPPPRPLGPAGDRPAPARPRRARRPR